MYSCEKITELVALATSFSWVLYTKHRRKILEVDKTLMKGQVGSLRKIHAEPDFFQVATAKFKKCVPDFFWSLTVAFQKLVTLEIQIDKLVCGLKKT